MMGEVTNTVNKPTDGKVKMGEYQDGATPRPVAYWELMSGNKATLQLTLLSSLSLPPSYNGRDKSVRGWSLCSLHSRCSGEPAGGGKLFRVPGVSEGAGYY